MSAFFQGLKQLWEWLKTQGPAIVISLFTYQEARIAQKEREKDALKLDLKLKENKDEVDKKYAGRSDDDILNDKFGGSDS